MKVCGCSHYLVNRIANGLNLVLGLTNHENTHCHVCGRTCGLNADVYGHDLAWIQINMA